MLEESAKLYIKDMIEYQHTIPEKHPSAVRFRIGILLTLLKRLDSYDVADVNLNNAKVTNVAMNRDTGLDDQQADMKKKEALKYGVEKLREMKRRMEEDRVREENILRERLKNDASL